MLDYNGIIALGKQFPGKKANRFIEWFTFSDESIDGKNKTKAYALFEFYRQHRSVKTISNNKQTAVSDRFTAVFIFSKLLELIFGYRQVKLQKYKRALLR